MLCIWQRNIMKLIAFCVGKISSHFTALSASNLNKQNTKAIGSMTSAPFLSAHTSPTENAI